MEECALPGQLNPWLACLVAAEDTVKCEVVGVCSQACNGGAMVWRLSAEQVTFVYLF